MEKEAFLDVLKTDKNYLAIERQLKRIHVVIRKMQTLVPGAEELRKFDSYSNCVSWLHSMRSLYELDRQILCNGACKSLSDEKKDAVSLGADEHENTDTLVTIDDISQ
jgi:hypothetical protein